MTFIGVLLRFFLEFLKTMLVTRCWPEDSLFIRIVYRAILKREPDEAGQRYYLEALQRRTLTRFAVLRSVLQSNEFRQIHRLPIHPLDALHQARMILVQHYLPPAEIIVDLGGAAEGRPEGALLAMGYPYHPREITIVDLPPDQRLRGTKGNEPYQSWRTADGVHIRYVYQSMADPLPIDSASVDLVWSGQSIEHITEWEADIVFQEVYRILKPGGYFCLDTPNAALTRLQSPNALIHPEHKKEYYVQELIVKLKQHGFEIVETKGICPMPESLRNGLFNYMEIINNITLSDNPEEGYLFYIRAVKPSQSVSQPPMGGDRLL